ncbi:hypothetical protein ZOSMA_192G00610 [Zostera marina]|uniref:ATPase AAA-type core domain-containing protein n=1 Tax=Zostera marina TaxID=29655 RepID=A0A0K9PPJ0_ZOSMR|nr:hypothetical protein ZOSMA_192G00610 [Zostera marina]
MPRNRMKGKRPGLQRNSANRNNRILIRHIVSKFPLDSLTLHDIETVVHMLRNDYPAFYCQGVKRQDLTRRVRNVLNSLWAERKDDYKVKRNNRSGSSSTSPTSTSTSSSESMDMDATFDAKVDADSDIANVILREKYKKLNASPYSGSSKKKLIEIDTSGELDLKTTTMSFTSVSKVTGKNVDAVTGRKPKSDDFDKGKEDMNEGLRFSDFGGINDIIEGLINKVIVPLVHPQIPAFLGVRPKTGILFHGPPGCGKTSLAHAIARETELPFYKISAADIVSGVSGDFLFN